MGIYINKGNEGFRQIRNSDDVLTVLIHLGYLSYDRRTKECYIPNMEVLEEMENAVRDILLVGISYDRDTKEHVCQIERWHKE